MIARHSCQSLESTNQLFRTAEVILLYIHLYGICLNEKLHNSMDTKSQRLLAILQTPFPAEQVILETLRTFKYSEKILRSERLFELCSYDSPGL